jgi:hypothetical protein
MTENKTPDTLNDEEAAAYIAKIFEAKRREDQKHAAALIMAEMIGGFTVKMGLPDAQEVQVMARKACFAASSLMLEIQFQESRHE